MSLLENKPLAILAGINLVAFMVIFWLIGLIMGRDDVSPQVEQIPPRSYTQPQMQAAAQNRPVIQQQTSLHELQATKSVPAQTESSIRESIIKEVSSPDTEEAVALTEEPVFIERSTTIDVFYDGAIARVEKTDDTGRRTINISNNLKEVERLSESDANYLAELRKMKAGEIGYMSMYKVTQEQAKSVTALKTSTSVIEDTEDENIDHFNKVDVSTKRQISKPVQLSLAQQIQSLVKQDEAPKTDNHQPQKPLQSEYIKSLKQASTERKNETRTIKVKFGDSLWKIAHRAYGTGFDYPRIYQANPHLKNPDMIRVGETLRVPL